MNLINENPLNIAVIFDQEVEAGGGFQQGLNAAILASKIDSKLANVKYFHTKNKLRKPLSKNGIDSQLIKLSFFQKIYLYIKTTEKYRPIFKFVRILFDFNYFESFLINKKIDLVYFISPSRFALDLVNLNFIFTVWDICHRDHLEFPEIKEKGEFENRELRLNFSSKRAISIIVDSKYSKSNFSKKYNVEKSRVSVIPFEPLKEIKDNTFSINSDAYIKEKFKIKNSFIFYPAQFWPHKNHIYILKAIYLLEKKYNLSVDVIFSGGDKGHKKNIQNYANKLCIKDRVIFTGFIPNQELISIYKMSIALVMPTFFGPTNIPPLEAFKLGIPVIYPDIKGLKEQVKKSGLLVDLNDPETLSTCILDLIKNTNLRNDLINKGFKLSQEIDKINRVKTLNKILKKFSIKFNALREIN